MCVLKKFASFFLVGILVLCMSSCKGKIDNKTIAENFIQSSFTFPSAELIKECQDYSDKLANPISEENLVKIDENHGKYISKYASSLFGNTVATDKLIPGVALYDNIILLHRMGATLGFSYELTDSSVKQQASNADHFDYTVTVKASIPEGVTDNFGNGPEITSIAFSGVIQFDKAGKIDFVSVTKE